jgi:lipoprotein-releasing system ATP-binding protein
MDTYIVKAHNICKSFYYPTQVDVLKNISIQVKEGQSIAITGASGEGKSTLLSLIGLLDTPSQGVIQIAGKKAGKRQAAALRNAYIGFVFQHFFLMEDYTVIDNVLMPSRIARKSVSKGSEAYRYAEELLDKVKLGHRTHFPVKLLSGGEKQRVAIARALGNNPKLILADEPSGNLDHKTSLEIYDLLFKCLEGSSKALVTVTHDLELAARCQLHLHLEDGILASHSTKART